MLWQGAKWRILKNFNVQNEECHNYASVVGSDSMDSQENKSNIDNEEMLPMLWGSSLRFSHCFNFSLVKCLKSPSVVGSDSMDLQ